MSKDIDAAEARSERPVLINWLWAYCGFMIFVGVCCLFGGIVLGMKYDEVDGGNDPEIWLGVALVLVAIGCFIALLHSIPYFLGRTEKSWKRIHALLIVSLIVWALTFQPLMVPAILLMVFWGKPEVKEYYGIEDKYRRRRGRDDGWDEHWDRPKS